MTTCVLPALLAAQIAAAPLHQLLFSPDGQYVLAQDDTQITILTVDPFSILFRIPAENARPAHFTPDSRQIVFLNSPIRATAQTIALSKTKPHVDRWNIARQTRVESRNLPERACEIELLSPDGALLLCIDHEGSLLLVDVASAETVFEKKRYLWSPLNPDVAARMKINAKGYVEPVRTAFSPDSRYAVVNPEARDLPHIILDVKQRSPVKLAGELRQLRGRYLTFISADRVIFDLPSQPKPLSRGVTKAKVIEFPSGKLLSEPLTPSGYLSPATDPGFVIVRDFASTTKVTADTGSISFQTIPSNRSTAAELSTGKVIISRSNALDVWGHLYVAEPEDGQAGLYEIGKGIKSTVAISPK